MNHTSIQRKLLSEGDLTYDSALKLALTVEAPEHDSKKLGEDPKHLKELDYTSTTGDFKGTFSSIVCRCGGPHLANCCKHKDVTCHFCKKIGHFASVCRAKACQERQEKEKPPPQQKEHSKHREHCRKKPPNSNNYLEEEPLSDTEYDMHTLNDKRTEPYLLDIVLNNVPVKMELDTGTAVSIISESTYQDIQKQSFTSSDSKLRTYTGQHIEVLGTTQMIVRYETKELYLW